MNDINIPSDKLIRLTDSLDSLFKIGGCDPTCHCCEEKIHIGDMFKLSTVNEKVLTDVKKHLEQSISPFKSSVEHQVMLCSSHYCTPEEMLRKAISVHNFERPMRHVFATRTGGCSIINGVIIP